MTGPHLMHHTQHLASAAPRRCNLRSPSQSMRCDSSPPSPHSSHTVEFRGSSDALSSSS